MHQRLRRMIQEYMKALHEKVDKILKVDFIYPVQKIEWVILAVVTPKKDRRWRGCDNFKPLNAAT